MKPILKLLLIVFLGLSTPQSQAAVPASSPAKPVTLFDGKSFTGWDGDTNQWWRIEDGALVGGSLKVRVPRNEFLATLSNHTNFILRAKFRLLGTDGFINSGIQIRSQRVPNNHEMSGYQCDLGDPTWWGSIYDESRRNKLMAQSDMAAINKVLKRGEWNDYRIHAEGRRIRTYINDVLGVDYTEADPAIVQWGRIGLQIHGGGAGEAWFKDITIEPLPAPKESPLPAQDQKAAFQLPPGFQIDLIAAEPDLPKPVTIAFDDAGRLWSITALEYPVDANENRAEAEALFQKGGRDKILVFDRTPAPADPAATVARDTPPYFSKPRVFADGLVMPLGVLPYRDGALVQYGTEILFLRDTDGDGRADTREVILSGFGIQDSHLFPHQFTRAPGGWLYLAQGAFNYSKVRTSDGVVIQFDQTKLARFRPDGSAFEILTHGPCNIWGLVINAVGETFLQEANDYGYPVIPFEPGLNVPGCGDRLFRPYAPRLPPMTDVRMGGTGLSGLALSEDPAGFPDPWHDVMFVANPITSQIQAVKIHRDGAGYKLERLPDFVTTSDEWFRPVAIHFGPDGGLYIVDWYNKIISHNEVPRNHPDRDKTRGRVWRVTHESMARARRPVPNVARASSEALLAHLASGNNWEWRAALNQIADRQAHALTPALVQVALGKTPASPRAAPDTPPPASNVAALQIHALWALESLGKTDPALLQSLLQSSDRNVRREAARVAGSSLTREAAVALVAPLAVDPDHQVRSEVIRAASGQIAPWKHLILEGAGKRPDPALGPTTLALLIRMGLPALPDPAKPGPGYEREFERYLVRSVLERHPAELAAFLDSPAATALPVENRRLACAALDGKDAARALARAYQQSPFNPTDEEWILLRRHEAHHPASVIHGLWPWSQVLGAAVRRQDLIQFEVDKAWILGDARDLLNAETTPREKPERVSPALDAVRLFKLKDAEPDVLPWLTSGSPEVKTSALKALEALSVADSKTVAALAVLASNPAEPVTTRNLALAALASARNPEAAKRLIELWPALNAPMRPPLVEQLARSKTGSETLLAALDAGRLIPDDLPMPVLEKMRALLDANPRMDQLWAHLAARMKPVLRLQGGPNDFVATQISLEGPFTVETWVNLDPGISNQDGILGHPGSADLNFHGARFRFFGGNRLGDIVVAKKAIVPNQWTHLAVTRDSRGEFRIYINGELDAVGSARALDNFPNLDLGRTIPASGGTAGSLMEFRVWKTARTPEQILAHFDRGYTGEPLPADLAYAFPGPDSSKAPLRGKARVEGTLDAPPLLTATEAGALEERLARFRQLAHSSPDPARGRALFETACMVCHQVAGQGSTLAPPLDGAAHRGVDGLLRALLTPNAAIESGYRKFRVETGDQELVEGFLVSQDAAGVVLRIPNAGDQRIPSDQIKRAGFTRSSLMPEGLLEGMEARQVSELISYLLTLK